MIVSGDKDFYQLIGPRIALLNPGRGGPAGVDEVWVDERNASERLGVSPRQVADYLALVGDSSDNVPGVKGIGDKGAVQLLTEYGDLETLLAQRGRDQGQAAPRSAGPVRRGSPTLQGAGHHPDRRAGDARRGDRRGPRTPDADALVKVLARLEFHSLAKRLTATTERRTGGRRRRRKPADREDAQSVAGCADVDPHRLPLWRPAATVHVHRGGPGGPARGGSRDAARGPARGARHRNRLARAARLPS